MFILQHYDDRDKKLTYSGDPVRRLNFAEIVILKSSVITALNNAAFGKTYIKDLIEKVASTTGGEIVSTNIVDLFTKVFESRGDAATNGGIWIYLKGTDSSSLANNWDYVGGKGFSEIYMNFSGISWANAQLPVEKQSVPRYEALKRYLSSPQDGGVPTIHELMHVAVRGRIRGTIYAVGGDLDYAEAAAELADDNNPSYKQSTYPNSAASGYWGERLDQACGYPSHLSHQFTNHKLYKLGLPLLATIPLNIA